MERNTRSPSSHSHGCWAVCMPCMPPIVVFHTTGKPNLHPDSSAHFGALLWPQWSLCVHIESTCLWGGSSCICMVQGCVQCLHAGELLAQVCYLINLQPAIIGVLCMTNCPQPVTKSPPPHLCCCPWQTAPIQ